MPSSMRQSDKADFIGGAQRPFRASAAVFIVRSAVSSFAALNFDAKAVSISLTKSESGRRTTSSLSRSELS